MSDKGDTGFVVDLSDLGLDTVEAVDVEVEADVLDTLIGRTDGYFELLQSRPDAMGAFVPFEQICKLLGSSEVRHGDFMTPVLAGQMEFDDGPVYNTNPFRHDDGPYDVYGGKDHIYLLGDRFVHARRPIKNASIIKGVVTGSVRSFKTIDPKEVPRDEASKVHTLVYDGASLLIDVAEGQAFEELDDLVSPHPTTLLSVTPKDTSLLELSALLEKYGRSYAYMKNDDWVAFLKESEVRSNSLTKPRVNERKRSAAHARPEQFVRPVELTDVDIAEKDISRLRKLLDDDVEEGVHLWTLSEAPTMEEVEAARASRSLFSRHRAKLDASKALANTSNVLSTTSQKLKRQATPSVSIKLTMTAEDVPLPDDEGLEDDVVAENMEGTFAMLDAEPVDEDAPVLGARRTLADVVNTVVNKLGFSVDGSERDSVVDSLIAQLTVKTETHRDKIDKLVEVYISKGLNPDMSRLVAVDEVMNKVIGTDITEIVVESAFQCCLILIHKSAKMARPLVRRLNARWAPVFTLSAIQSAAKEPSLVEYVCRVLSDVTSISAQDVSFQTEMEYSTIEKSLKMSIQTALTRDDVIRSVETLANLVTDTAVPDWFNLKPDFRDESTRNIAANRSAQITQNVQKSTPLPISYDTEAIVDQAPAKDQERTLALSENITQMKVSEGFEDVSVIAKKDLSVLRSKVVHVGVNATLMDLIDHANEDTLFALVDRYVPAFMSVVMATSLDKWQIGMYEKTGLSTDIMDFRKSMDRAKITKIRVPQRLSRYVGVPVADARELVIADCYKFLLDVHEAGGFEALKLFDAMVVALNKRVSDEEEIKILEARRETVKMARQTVRQNLPTELQWMYEDLVQQGVVDVARDAVMEPEAVDDDDQERLDGYDLDEAFSDDE